MGAVILFDGVCNFCDGMVNFIIEHDPQGYFKFAPLQSESGRNLAEKHGFESSSKGDNTEADGGLVPIDSVMLLEDGKAYIHSNAALRIVSKLDSPWRWMSAMKFIPTVVRDFFYKLFARHRYRFFGKKDQCMIPTSEIRDRFLK